MRNYDPDLVAEIAKEAAASFWLLSIGLSTTLCYTDADVPIPYGGSSYVPRALAVQEVQQSSGFSVDEARVSIGDADRAVMTALLSGDPAGAAVILSLTVVGADCQPIATGEVMRGDLVRWDATEERVQIVAASEFRFWRKKSLRLPTPSCPWAFKETECGYTGSGAWCDQTPERCRELGNYDNFGGRKFISDIEDQKIYWGPEGY